MELTLCALAFAVMLVVGVPIAIAIGLVATAALLTRVSVDAALATSAQRIAAGMDSTTLLAIPLFLLAGQLASRGGMANQLVDLARALLGRIPGALAGVNVLACMLFGAISGSAVASASAVGSLMDPRMRAEGYSRGFTTAVNVSAATTGLIIPPSNVLIVYSLASGGLSIAALFLAGYVPGILLGGALLLAAGLGARQDLAAAARPPAPPRLAGALRAALPGLGLPVLIIGGIASGLFTATESAAIAAFYALGVGLLTRTLTLPELPPVFRDSALTTGVVMLVIGTSMGLAWVLAHAGVPQALGEWLLGLSTNPIVVLLVINAALLVVGTVLDITPAILIFTPILLPAVTRLGIDPVHFGIILVMNLCIGLCTPPVGSVLFVGCGVSGARLGEVVRPLLPLYAVMVAVLLGVTLWPPLSLALPRALGY